MQKLFKHKGFWYEPRISKMGTLNLHGPLCPKCYADLPLEFTIKKCINCEAKIEEIGDVNRRKQLARLAYDAKGREYFDKISLDKPLIMLKTRDEDEKYFIEGRLKQKDGRLMGVVYFGKKSKSEKGKTQLFIDIDDEQIRFDKSDMHPKEILSKLVVDFKETEIQQKFNN